MHSFYIYSLGGFNLNSIHTVIGVRVKGWNVFQVQLYAYPYVFIITYLFVYI